MLYELEAQTQPVTLLIGNVVYILDDIDMLPTMIQTAPPLPSVVDSALRIVLVEDNDYVRELSVCLFESPDREVVAFATGEEALAAFIERPFDIVITDVSLPKMSGIELAKSILKMAPETWLIIASGYKMPAGLDKLGAHVRSVTKPFEAEQVEALIGEVKLSRPSSV
jgi:CheY-like chemotaxis protein